MPGLSGHAGMILLQAQGLGVRHGDHIILHDVNFTIRRGEIVTVVGPNGSGKSTLVRALIGLEPASAGKVSRADSLRIGYVPQRMKVEAGLPMTVRRFLSLPQRVSDDDAARALSRVGVAGLEKRQLSQLSGGQFQRVLVARAMLSAPDLLILDEPTQGLDQPGVAAFYRLLAELRGESGLAVLLVSHDLHVVMSASDRVICLNGHICCEGAPDQVSAAPEYRALFGFGDGGVLALYRHHHDHDHDHGHSHHVHNDGAANDV
jgi:zinc transport system ATP-binding protein